MTMHCLVAAVEKEREAVVRFLLDRLQRLAENETHHMDDAAARTRREEFLFRAKLWALELACERGNLQIVRDLIASGGIHLAFRIIDHRSDDENGGKKEREEKEEEKHKSQQHYHDAVVKYFHGLFRACEKGSVKIVSALLDCGLPVNMRELPSTDGSSKEEEDDNEEEMWTALHYAAKRGDLALIQKLVARGANPSLTARFEGRRATPLAVAEAMRRDNAVVRYLHDITPRPIFHRPEVVLSAAGGFLVVALAVILSHLSRLLFSP